VQNKTFTPSVIYRTLCVVTLVAQPGLFNGESCEFRKNKHFLQVFGGDKEVRLS
jgi:hypothetical protein